MVEILGMVGVINVEYQRAPQRKLRAKPTPLGLEDMDKLLEIEELLEVGGNDKSHF